MRPFIRSFLLAITLLLCLTARAQAGALAILSPQAGAALKGVVTITGTSALDGFVRAEVAFAYSRDVTGAWFPLAESDQPVSGGALATWDTSAITDGDYDLRLRVTLADGSPQSVIVEGLRVRNTTPVETDTPVPLPTGAPTLTQTPTPTPRVTASLPAPRVTATPPGKNDLDLSGAEISASLLMGGALAVVVLIISAIYLALKALIRR
jgi:hypothetical protein